MHSEQDCPQLTSVLPCRHESDTTDLYCIFDLDTKPTGWLVGDGTGTRIIVWVRLGLR